MFKSIIASKYTIVLSILILSLMTALLVESSQPPLPLLGKVNNLDKVAHFSAFSCLSLLICALFLKVSSKEKIPLFSAPLIITTIFGIIDESFQTVIPSLSSSLYDLLADVLGAIFAILIANQINRYIRKKSVTMSD